jgi:biotin-dependent carboxylase-like uncharacterized protein
VIEILDPGPLATVQDLGRHGYAALGVPRSGAFDAAALRSANRLVGNPPGAAGIEITLGGLWVRTTAAATVALTGALCAGVPDWYAAVTLAGGARFRLGTPPTGLRTYLAVRGGIDVPAVLGSRSSDRLSGLGPAPLRPGDLLPTGRGSELPGKLPGGLPGRPPALSPVPLRLSWGPRDDWFVDDARHLLLTTTWTARPESDRVGVRLDGPPLERVRDDELPSEPTLPGAVQVPPDGRPILFGPDAPVTGGYPVIGVVDDVSTFAQVRPGDPVRFTA